MTWSKILFFFCLAFILAVFLFDFSQAKEPHTFFPGLKDKFSDKILTSVPFPESAFILALVLGDQDQIPFALKQKLSQSGLRHIIAVSGLHIVILAETLVYLCLALGVNRLRANFFSLILIWLFLFLIGFKSSAVRAVLMASSFLIADILGRPKAIFRVLVFSAALMLLFNPGLLKNDLGFQLSFLAVLGIAFFNPFFSRLFSRIFKKRFAFFTSVLAVTFSAQAMTLPLVFYYFGSVSLVSGITNILVLPVMPYLMGFSFVFLLLSLAPYLGFLLVLPVYFLTKYIIFIVNVFSSLPFASFSLSIHWAWLLPCYLTLLVLAFWLYRKQQLTFS